MDNIPALDNVVKDKKQDNPNRAMDVFLLYKKLWRSSGYNLRKPAKKAELAINIYTTKLFWFTKGPVNPNRELIWRLLVLSYVMYRCGSKPNKIAIDINIVSIDIIKKGRSTSANENKHTTLYTSMNVNT